MSGLSPELVIQLMDEGMTQSAIAREYGVTRQYINILAKRGGHEPVVPIITENMPWSVPAEYYDNTIYQALRLAAHANYAGLDALRGTSQDKLARFVRKLSLFNQVIDFDPSYPAIPGHSNTPGFAFVPRTPADGDYMIKIRPGVRITPTGKKIWKMPDLSA